MRNRARQLRERITREFGDWVRDEVYGLKRPVRDLHHDIETLIEEAFNEEVRDRANEIHPQGD